MARKLKVYQAPFGFHESVVAASSQAAALRAWGSHQNLFADGSAKVATDEAAIAAALAHPETPLRRAVGSSDPFQLEAKSLPKVPRAEKAPTAKPKAETPAKKPAKPEPPPTDRTPLDQAEKRLRDLADKRRREEDRFKRRLEDLQAEQADAQRSYVEERKAADAAVETAREAYRKAGGRA